MSKMDETTNASMKKAHQHQRSVEEAYAGNTGSARYMQTSDDRVRLEEGKRVTELYDYAVNPIGKFDTFWGMTYLVYILCFRVDNRASWKEKQSHAELPCTV